MSMGTPTHTKQRKAFKDNGDKNIPSAWFFIFAYYHDRNKGRAPTWKDLESNIEEFVCDAERIDRMNPYEETDGGIQKDSVDKWIIQAVDSYLLAKAGAADKAAARVRAKIKFVGEFSHDWEMNRLSARASKRRILLEELRDFESDFRDYLKKVLTLKGKLLIHLITGIDLVSFSKKSVMRVSLKVFRIMQKSIISIFFPLISPIHGIGRRIL
ncbi:hypothetical protein PMO82_09430 [Bifidobacterium pseudocatenulatum]|uniref:hypothetical protein n=2 Tax=Bifidobacterium pseudocatenulatum TaxID=28026 RepID=UPI0023302ADA|nr:hypothetical protein [Bifidobacterium pseudocatenulatum]MDB6519336.1 hypothetical protein [Bifidobacterium pseudocatenulatum]